ncbi:MULTISPECIES: BRCT domain-containing protein [unclassified Lysinibacillus]|uniref:BRCT domain-containing protein n=1 Tax=unclassified Lysinibacillus TaxID=2636778 RepID=UPI002553D6E2|nr:MULTISPECIES: BRCT domain-containing protein [unclassified Lysinibacillus]MDM5250994.1 BRCT domain-containing protein [Lysinibacillus sp. G4S2]
MNKNKDNIEVILLSDPSECSMHPFYNKQIVFTGALSAMTRSEAAKRVRACGGIMQGTVTPDTDFLILGDKRRGISTKQLKAEKLISLGLDIQIIIEDDFIWLISMQIE